MVLCVVTHSLIFAFSSVDRSAQFLCFFRQPLPSLPDAPFEQVNPFVAYPRHTLGDLRKEALGLYLGHLFVGQRISSCTSTGLVCSRFCFIL